MRYSRDQLIALIQQTAASIGFPPAVAVEQLRRESANFRDDVVYGSFVGGAGERGVAQFTPGTWQRFGTGMHQNAYNPDLSLSAWAAYTSYLMGLFGGDLTKVLTSYNGGEGHLLDPGRYGPPSAAAKRYASEVLARAGAASSSPASNDSLFTDESEIDWAKWGMVAAFATVLFIALDN